MALSPLRQHLQLLATLKYALFLAALLVFLPLAAFRWNPLFLLLGGLFRELGGWDLFWTCLGFFAAAWSLMLSVGLLLGDAAARWRSEPAVEGEEPGGGMIPPWSVRLLGLPAEGSQLLLFAAVAAVGCAAVVATAAAPLPAGVVVAVAASLSAYLTMILLFLPARLAEPGYDPLPGSRFAHLVWGWLDWPVLAAPARALRRAVSRLLHLLRIRHVLEEGPGGRPQLAAGHFFALTNLMGLFVLLAVLGLAFFPPSEPQAAPSSASYLYVLLTFAVWALLGLDTHLARIRVSPLLVIVAWVFVTYGLAGTDHSFRVHTKPLEAPLTPVEVARTSRAPKNLVVVACSGGGILASGWIDLALRNLILDRPQLAHEIRLLSTVSGSSVGSAFYLDAVREVPDLAALPRQRLEETLEEVYTRATTSSLASAAYGLAFLDAPRLAGAGWLPGVRAWDRGLLLEDAWGKIAGSPRTTLADLRPAIRDGRVPAPIMASTVMESGHRVMLTPVGFEGPPGSERAPTLAEYLLSATADEEASHEADLLLWTAARLSATFPYVSPASRAALASDRQGPAEKPAGQGAHHFLDGGYFDNFGVTSALDWLEPVLAARLEGEDPEVEGEGLEVEKVFILLLNPFELTNPKRAPPAGGAVAALAAPLFGALGILNGSAASRDASDLARFKDSWNTRFEQANLPVCVETAEIRPPEGTESPLSWHLTPEQIAAQRRLWPPGFDQAPPEIREPWGVLRSFLAAEGCP